MRDVFLIHASEDKERFVRPLVVLLQDAGITYWVDEAEVLWGDSLVRKVDEGLTESRFAVVFISEQLLSKNWPRAEFEAAINAETSTGRVSVLALLCDSSSVQAINRFPLLARKRYVRWQDGAEVVIAELQRRLVWEYQNHWMHHFEGEYAGPVYTRVVTRPENRNLPHRITIEWGPWVFEEPALAFSKSSGAFLTYAKRFRDGVPVSVTVFPECRVEFGQGSPPTGAEVVDINGPRWRRLDDRPGWAMPNDKDHP